MSNFAIFSAIRADDGSGQVFHLPQWGPFHTLPLCPFNLGGDTYDFPRALDLKTEHYDQTDKTMNAKLWGEHPWEHNNFSNTGPSPHMADLEQKLDKERNSFMLASGGGTPNPLVGVPHERIRIIQNIFTLELLMDTLHIHGFLDSKPKPKNAAEALKWRGAIGTSTGPKPHLPDGYGDNWMHPRDRKKNMAVEPVQQLVQLLNAKMTIINNTYYASGHCIDAAREYAKILLELYPWTASPLFFKHEEAFSYGIAQLESNLWTQLGLAAVKSGRLTGYWQWYTHANDCSEAILNMRYTTHNALSKAGFIMHEGHGSHYEADPGNLGSWGALMLCPAVISINSYIIGHMYRLADKGDDAWAHKDCKTGHTCNSRQFDAVDIMEAKIKDPIILPNGPGGIVKLKTDYSVNN